MVGNVSLRTGEPICSVAVVIPNWNGRHLLPACLAALSQQSYPDFEMVIVDNGSTDGSIDWITETHPQVRLLVNQENQGFAAAANQGIRATAGRYVALLNSDTQVDTNWLAALVEAAEANAEVGMCASKMLFSDRPEVINSTGICLDLAGIAWDCRGGSPNDDSDQEPQEVFGPCGGAALYRREMLDEIGLLDEDFFAYLEDVDLAWRARRAGWRALYVPTARVLHHHSATGVEGSPFKSFHLGRNKIWLLVKNYPFGQAPAYGFLCLLYDFAAVAYALAGRRDPHALYGRIAALSGLRSMWRKRHTSRTWNQFDSAWFAPLTAPWRVPDRYRHIATAEERCPC
jgi:GT2 family glycosyltransferase